MSGQELLAVSMEEISDVRDVKSALRGLHSFPVCMQRLLHNDNVLDNFTQLDASIDLQFVLVAPSTPAQQLEAAEELAESCDRGHLKVSRLLLEAGADTDWENEMGFTGLMRAAENGHTEIGCFWQLVLAKTCRAHTATQLS